MAITYNDEKHEYSENGVVFPSVTQVLRAVGITPDLSGIDKGYAEMGTTVHENIQNCIIGKKFEERYVPKGLDDYFYNLKNEGKLVLVELLLKSKYGYAGRADVIIVDEKEKIVDVVDFKTGTPEDDGCRWQLSCYMQAYIESIGGDYKPGKLIVFEGLRKFLNGEIDNYTTKTFEPRKESDIARLMNVYNAGLQMNNANAIEVESGFKGLANLNDALLAVYALDARKKKLEAQIAGLKAELCQYMAENDIKKFASSWFSFSYVPAGTRKAVDTEKLKAAGIYDEYVKVTNTEPSVRITENKQTKKELG